MQRKLLSTFSHYIKLNKKRQGWRGFVRVVAGVVVFCTTYALILPAITMEKLQCGLEEHTHSESCYCKVVTEPEVLLTCTYDSLGVHVHTEECYDSNFSPVCGFADYVIHSHNDGCWDKNGKLVCPLPVVKEHVHTDACYQTPEATEAGHIHGEDCYTVERGALLCQIPETEGHTHDDSCRARGELLCQIPEQQAHTHGDECRKTVLNCELVTEPHLHTDSCYQQLVCELPEDESHTHSEECNGKVLNCNLTEQTHNHTDACYRTDLVCGLSETGGHAHGDSCYASVLVCERAEEEAHAHTDSCYAEVKTLVCGQEEVIPGETTTSIMTEPELVCGKEEIKPHTHNEETCYETAQDGQKVLICTKLEVLEHSHNENCYVTVESEDDNLLTCMVTEGHIHEESCYDENGALICEEVENHIHGNLCYGTWELNCGKDEHTHSEECYAAENIEETTGPADTEETTGPADTEETTGPADAEETTGPADTEETTGPADTEETTGPTDAEETTDPAVPEETTDPDGMEESVKGTLTQEGTVAANQNSGISLLGVLEQEIVASGEVGSLRWEITTDVSMEYTLTFTGSGDMPDYSSASDRPWITECSGKSVHLRFGEGVTGIGNWAFAEMKIVEIDWGGVTRIGSNAFYRGSGMSDLTIGGNVTTIGAGAFYEFNASITSLTLGDHVTTVEDTAFSSNTVDGYAGITVHIPASLTTINGNPFQLAKEFTVDENNPSYSVIDGVLFNKDQTKLTVFPPYKAVDVYNVPDSVKHIVRLKSYNVRRFNIPAATSSLGWNTFAGNVREIWFADNSALTTLTNDLFLDAPKLQVIHFPENTSLKFVNKPFKNTTYSALQSIKIPSGTQTLDMLGTYGVGIDRPTRFPALKDIIYDAANANITSEKSVFCDASGYVLTIGPSVDVIPENFAAIAAAAETIVFEPNTFEIQNNGFAGAHEPLEHLSGYIHVDEQGLVYAFDTTSNSAELVYCPPGISSIQIPGTINTNAFTNHEGQSVSATVCVVNSVRKDSLLKANNLTSITFSNPENIINLDAHAMANCPTLSTVNGRNDVASVSQIFTGTTVDPNVFYNTGLHNTPGSDGFAESMDGMKDSLTISNDVVSPLTILVGGSDNTTMKWVGGETSGGYQLLTGDTLFIEAPLTNNQISDQYVYRMYFRTTSNDAHLSITPGSPAIFGNIEAMCYATDDPYTVYLEFMMEDGDTVTAVTECTYPTPSSAGGGLTVWGTILPKDEAAQSVGKVYNPVDGKYMQAHWKTEPDEYKLDKVTMLDEPLSIVVAEDNRVTPNTTPAWKITLSRAEDLSSPYGKDLVKYIDYVDIMEFPNGIDWSDAVKLAVKAGNVSYDQGAMYANGIKVAHLFHTGAALHSPRLVWVEDAQGKGTVAIQWRMYNTEDNIETYSMTLYIHPQAITVKTDIFSVDGGMIKNSVKANVVYSYNEADEIDAFAEQPIGGGVSKIAVTKTSYHNYRNGYVPLGGDIDYTIDVYNSGDQMYQVEGNEYYIRDTLPQFIAYITPENMERMFAEAPRLRIIISQATLTPWQEVTGAYGDTAYLNSANTGAGKKNQTLTVTYANGTYTVSVDGGGTYTAGKVADALKAAGYSVCTDDAYGCEWPQNENGESFTLQPGEHIKVHVYATMKDTFRVLGADYPNEILWSTVYKAVNWAGWRGGDNATTNVTDDLRREAVLSKSVLKDGTETTKLSGRPGEVLEYRLKFSRAGKGGYDNLPMIDDMYGCQYLLVPAEKNPGLANKNLSTHVDGGITYYVLTEGEYKDVFVGVDMDYPNQFLKAAFITVKPAEPNQELVSLGGNAITASDVHTNIKWYFSHLGSDDNGFTLTVSYKSLLVMPKENQDFTLGNVVWMNQESGKRLYATMWGHGTILDFKKEIVLDRKNRDNPNDDVLADHSIVKPGETVTYRISLHNTNAFSYAVNGTEIRDMLPFNYNIFEWNGEAGGNVKLSAEDIITIVSDNTKPITYSGLENWYIDPAGANNGGQQYIRWPEQTSIQFYGQGTLYLYVELTYPNTEGENLWNQYVESVQGNGLMNTFYLYKFPSSVEHQLEERGEARLQKGVYGMYHHTTSYGWIYNRTGTSRTIYNNKDSQFRSVAYFVELYNGSGKRLYLNELHDLLPAGFSYRSLRKDGNIHNTKNITADEKSIVTLGGYDPFGSYPLTTINANNVLYRSATIKAVPTTNGVTFQFEEGKGEYAVSYDAERDQYYLKSNEAIVFAYTCDIGVASTTDDSATNTIAMPYTDYMNTDVDLAGVAISAPESIYYENFNNGESYVRRNQDVVDAYGFASSSNEEWLVSDVTVERGGISPGIRKAAVSYTYLPNYPDEGPIPYENSVRPGKDYLVNWEVLCQNNGTQSLTGYEFIDVMEKPYVFQGSFDFRINDRWGTAMHHGTMFTILDRAEIVTESPETVVVQYEDVNYNVVKGGPAVALGNNLKLSIGTDENGNETITINFHSPELAIPEGGTLWMQVSTINPTGVYKNRPYNNIARLKPTSQPFETVSQGSIIRDENGEPVYVQNSASVNVSSGFSTSAVKQVQESDNPSNMTDTKQADDKRKIVIDNERSIFTYNLSVTNESKKKMTKLVIIDSLPQIGDKGPFDGNGQRLSEFTVWLPENPNVRVSVKDANGTVTDDLNATVQFSTSTIFTDDDWAGVNKQNTEKWTTDPTGARSIRVILGDNTDTYTMIPENSTVTVSFDAVAYDKDGRSDAAPGEIAWNNFGYHYKVDTISDELEAVTSKIGVMIPGVPTLKKQLVAGDGKTLIKAEEKQTFTFLVYEGEPLTGDYFTVDDLYDDVKNNGRRYEFIYVDVEQGESESVEVPLTDVPWTWTQDSIYTVVEYSSPIDYTFNHFVDCKESQYKLTYNREMVQKIVCVNQIAEWEIQLLKTDVDKNPLSGAVFALYSPSEADKVGDGFVNQWNAQLEFELNGKDWYLMSVKETGADGLLSWSELLEESYYLLEIKAPDGYNLPKVPGKILTVKNIGGGVVTENVVNEPGYEIPETGGAGTTSYTLGGLLIMTAAAILLYIHILKRRKEERPSF